MVDQLDRLAAGPHKPQRGRLGYAELGLELGNLRGSLMLEPADEPTPTNNDGALDWTGIRAIRILAIAGP